MKRNLIFTLVLTISISLSVMFFPCQSEARDLALVSADSTGVIGDATSRDADVSSDGAYVGFESSATNLISSDTNVAYDVFIKDISTGDVERISVTLGGVEGDDDSYDASLSSDASIVSFDSDATNFVSGDGNVQRDVFVSDAAAVVTRESTTSGGVEGDDRSRYNCISSDGRWVTFSSEATNLTAIPVHDPVTHPDYNVYIKDTQTGAIVMVSKDHTGVVGGDGDSETPRISTDGLYVVFESSATNLVAGDTNGRTDIFLYDRIADTLERISLDTNSVQTITGSSYDPAITPDGVYVVFESNATDLVAGDTNAQKDVFVYDSAGAGNGITRVSMDSTGIVQGDDTSCDPDISDDGKFVTFASQATNLGPVTTFARYNVYLKDVSSGDSAGAITLLSQNSSSEEGDGDSEYPSISADGSIVAFESVATNLVSGDNNSSTDVFVSSPSSTSDDTTTTTSSSSSSGGCFINTCSIF